MDVVKENYPEILSRDVLNRFNKRDVQQEPGMRYAVDEESQGSGTSDAMSGMDFESDSEAKSRYDELIDRYGRMEAGMEPRVDVAVPKQTFLLTHPLRGATYATIYKH